MKPSIYHDNVLYYISGYVARKIAGKVRCGKCSQTLHEKSNERVAESTFTERCNRGGLIFSNDMYVIIKATDKFLREHLTSHGVVRGMKKSLTSLITRKVLQSVSTRVYPSIWKHSFENSNLETEDNHVHQIIKEACSLYVKMIGHHHERLLTDRFINNDIGTLRHSYNKTVLFLHQ